MHFYLVLATILMTNSRDQKISELEGFIDAARRRTES